MPQIELPLIVKKRILYVLLKDESPQPTISISLSALETHLDVIQTIANCDSVASIGILSWFYNPNVLDMLLALLFLLDQLIILGEAKVLRIFCSLCDMEGKWQDFEGIFSLQL